MHDKYDIWTGPGGHIDPGEDPNEAVMREIWEEVGLKVRLIGPKGWMKDDTDTNLDLVPPLFLNRHRINDTHDHSALIFIAQSDSREVSPQTDADLGCEYLWVNKTNWRINLSETNQFLST
jgi:8-oxo-dGTP pyrophosphatase MutT (NUDIX family)